MKKLHINKQGDQRNVVSVIPAKPKEIQRRMSVGSE